MKSLAVCAIGLVGSFGCVGNVHDTTDAGGGGGEPDASAAVDADQAAPDAEAPPVDAAPKPIKVLRGVDRASAFSVAEAKTLKDNDAVQFTGVYIGGPCDGGNGWTKAVVNDIYTATDWQFEPIYVGQESSGICPGAHDLSAAQGKTDGDDAAAIMATFGWDGHKQIPVVLDLESGAYSSSPSGALAYVKAWRDEVRAKGYLAYLYSSPAAINDFSANGVKLDGAWPASWFYSDFADVKPSDLDQLTSGTYTGTNRAWQYAGSFAVSGAGTVDADTSDLLLAPKPGGTNE